jgi:hypothetical protein
MRRGAIVARRGAICPGRLGRDQACVARSRVRKPQNRLRLPVVRLGDDMTRRPGRDVEIGGE